MSYDVHIPRCAHIKTNGTQCGSPALAGGRPFQSILISILQPESRVPSGNDTPDGPQVFRTRYSAGRVAQAFSGFDLHSHSETMGAPSLRFLQGWVAILPTQALFVLLCEHFLLPPFAKCAKSLP